MNKQVQAGVDDDDNDAGNGYDDSSDSTDQSDSDDNAQGASGSQSAEDDHRAALGSLVQNLQDRGIDVDSLAQEAGLSSADVDNLQHDDVVALSQYIAQSHPEVTQQVFSRFPQAQGLLGRFFGQ